MAFVVWPAGVRYRPERDRWSYLPFRKPIETEMEGGNVRVRRRPGDRVSTMKWGRMLDATEMVAWQAFVELIGDGTARFVMPVTVDGATYTDRLVQIVGGINEYSSPGGSSVNVAFTALVFPPEMTPA